MNNHRKTTSQFIDEAQKGHGDRYDYSEVEYVNTHTPVKIKCQQCGAFFLQEPASHLAGRGCPKCAHKQTHLRVNQEKFIEKAKAVHGDKYDYSKTEYIDMHTKVVIICPIHGEFTQNAQSHISGNGCPKCKRDNHIKRITKDLDYFLDKARFIHGDKYDYSKVVYKGSNEKVCIICPTHGEFYQSPADHLQGHGCVHCGNAQDNKRIGTEEFVNRAKAIHGDKYDYSKVAYRSTHDKVCIVCPKHGEFMQRPYEHLKGSGCYACANNKKGITRKSNRDEFITKAQEVHGTFYDYSRTDYVNSKRKVCIICPKHGEFWQSPNAHLHGYGCMACGREKTLEAQRSNTEEFIEKARAIHGDKYDYSKVVYVRNDKKVCIICPKHGEFRQSPLSHLEGNGCHKCKQTKGETKIELYLKRNQIQYEMEHIFSCKGYPYKRRLFKVDFWLESRNMIIEFNGIQHYEANNFMGGEKKYLQRVRRDADLRDFCGRNKYRLIEIPYTDYNKIDYILDRELKI